MFYKNAFVALGVMMIASPVLAGGTCVTGCNPQPDPGPTYASFDFTGGGGGAGNAIANFVGGDGEAVGEKFGEINTAITLGGQGGLCGTPECGDFNAAFAGDLMEALLAGATVSTEHSDTPIGVMNTLASSGMLQVGTPEWMVNIGGAALGASEAGAGFSGTSGMADAATAGDSMLEMTLNVDGLCPNCNSGNWSFMAEVNESAAGAAYGYSNEAGKPADAFNTMGTNAGITFDLVTPLPGS